MRILYYSIPYYSCVIILPNLFTDHKNNTNSWKQIFEPVVLRPFRLMLIYFFFKNLLSVSTLLPYFVSIFNILGAPVNVEWTIVSYLYKPARYDGFKVVTRPDYIIKRY